MPFFSKLRLLYGIFALFVVIPTFAQVLDGRTLTPVHLDESLKAIEPGTVIVIGENHNQKVHQLQQLTVMKTLRANGHRVHTGLEFIYYPDQKKVDQFRLGIFSEEQFLKEIGWGGDDFSFYRDQVLFPNLNKGEHAWALNLPRSITGQIAKLGLESLNDLQKGLLPPNFTFGRDIYKKRFMQTMPHLEPEKAENYFISQSAWDDTMAWRAAEIMKNFPNSTLVIISGDFHVAFGGGLPDRMKARGIRKIFTISQFNTEGLSPEDIQTEISPQDGEIRADLIWLENLQ